MELQFPIVMNGNASFSCAPPFCTSPLQSKLRVTVLLPWLICGIHMRGWWWPGSHFLAEATEVLESAFDKDSPLDTSE